MFCCFQMRMMIFLPNLLLAIVSIQPSVPQPHDPLPSNWFSILKHLHSTACIPVGYECTPPHDGTFPWDTGESFPSQRLVRRPREVFEHPLAVKRNPGVCCGFCSCETDCLNHASCCLSMYESLSHARRETSKTK